MKAWLESLADNATPGIEESLSMLGGTIDWLNEMKKTPQDPEWHGEGDVCTHIGYVLDALYHLLQTDAHHITGWKRQTLILAAILHDVGKTVRTKEHEIKGVMRIVSPKHEAVGRSYLTFKLMALPLPFKVIWNLLGLVGEHHMPKRLVVRNLEKGEYLSLSRRADIELLYWLEVADMQGRICPDLPQQLGHLDEYRMFAEDYGIWEKPYEPHPELEPHLTSETEQSANYIYAHALRGMEQSLISMPVEAVAKSYEHKTDFSNLLVLCGPSGAGKSTWVAKNADDFAVVSLDTIREELNGRRSDQKNRGRILQQAKEQLKASLRQKQNVVWDATNLRIDFRKIICDLGRNYHALVTLVVFLAPEQAFISGNRNRQHSIPDTVLSKQFEQYEFPTPDEAHRTLYINEQGETLHNTGFPTDTDGEKESGPCL